MIVALTNYYISLRSTGEVKSTDLTVVQRHIRLDGLSPSMNITGFVDNWVKNYSYGDTNIICLYCNDPIQHIVAYGYNFSKTSGTWDGWTFNQLKTLIDRFHYHGWKVVHETTSVSFDHEGGKYIKTKHPELTFTNALGKRAGIDFSSGGWGFAYDWWAKYATADTYLNISAGTRLLDIYTQRFKQMMQDGLIWDGWFGTDGWNARSVTHGILFGNNWEISLPAPESHYSFSSSEIEDWTIWTKVTLSPTWNTMNNTERANWIRSNATVAENWFEFWLEKQAKLLSQIRTTARTVNPDFFIINTVDVDSEWAGGHGRTGLLDFPTLAKFNAVDYHYIDTESTGNIGGPWQDDFNLQKYAELGKIQAYTAALLRTKDPFAVPLIGLQVRYGSANIPNWVNKMEYLAQAQSYVWVNGTRYRATDPTKIMIQYPKSSADGYDSETKELFGWIKLMLNLLNSESLKPIYLGPTYIIPFQPAGSPMAWWGFNYTFAQWVDVLNIRNHPERINASMQTLFIDMIQLSNAPHSTLLDTQSTILQMFTNGTLNVVAYSHGYRPTFSSTWGAGSSEDYARVIFHMGTESRGSSALSTVISGIQEPFGIWIASGYEGQTFELGDPGNYLAGLGFVPVANFTDNRIALGIYYNSTSGRFVYGRRWSGAIGDKGLPRSVINKALYWGSGSPMNSSEPLLDYKVFRLSDGTVLIPMMNHKNLGGYDLSWQGESLPSTVSLDTYTLGLGNEIDYVMYWQSDSINAMTISDWGKISVNLQGMVDILVIAPKTPPQFSSTMGVAEYVSWNFYLKSLENCLGKCVAGVWPRYINMALPSSKRIFAHGL